MSISKRTNDEVIELWNTQNFRVDSEMMMPQVYGDLHTDGFLSIGLNPAMPDGFNWLEGEHLQNVDLKEFFRWNNRDRFNRQLAIEIEQQARESYAFFKRFRQIRDAITALGRIASWEHIDLFFVRKTEQAVATSYLFEKKGDLTPFGSEQFRLSCALIEAVRPEVIWVANNCAAKLLENYYDVHFDETQGYHLICIAGRNIPVFFTSSPTPRGGLVDFAFERLKWHILKAWKQQAGAVGTTL